MCKKLIVLTIHLRQKKKHMQLSGSVTLSVLQSVCIFCGSILDICVTCHTLLILMDDGAPGKPGRHVLNAVTSLNGPRPHELIAATRNLYAVPGCNSRRFSAL